MSSCRATNGNSNRADGVPFGVFMNDEWIACDYDEWWCELDKGKLDSPWITKYKGIISQLPQNELLTAYYCHC